MSASRVSSPASTGGAGTSFEQHVGAYWLAQLLVRGIPPILINTTVSEVHLQTERLGWHTDDFLIVCERLGMPAQKLAGQVKKTFTVSAADAECVQAIGDFWKDFQNSDRFSPTDDRLVLVTLRGTNTLLEHFVGLLDCARASRNGAELDQRLATDGFISDKSVHYCRELQKIVQDLEVRPVTASDLWPFLRALHVLSLDLHSSSRQTESLIKSLLGHTVSDGDPIEVAAASWNELVSMASIAMAESRSVGYADLPAVLKARHSTVSSGDKRVLSALADHTAPILREIRSTIGPDFHLQRASLVQNVLRSLEESQVVLLAGTAGCGKSSIGKEVITVLSLDHFGFGFRVEEFAQPHFDATLNAAQVPANAVALSAILATQGRKIVLVESVERLLERATRDAFSDLMNLVADDASLRLILTCRDYSVEQVRASFLQRARIRHTVIAVPPLDDAELAQVEGANPALAKPLKSPALRNILRNPYLLDRALEIPWSSEKPVPESEREFRALFWREIVRADHRVAPGLAHRREQALHEIAVRRARALSSYVACHDLDPEVIESLRRDSLVSSAKENPSLVATAHDVLEDWAILQWLEEQHLVETGSFEPLSSAIGPHPAIRRSYRKWVAELIQRDVAVADRLFRAAVSATDISVHFRDDTLVSLLKAPLAPDLLVRNESRLLRNNMAILKRVIHLLRVACVKAPDWLGDASELGSVLNVPDGPAWPTILMLVYRNLASFPSHERGLLLGLVEDAVRSVSWSAPDLEGADYVAGIAHWLLDGFRGYGGQEQRKRVLKVLAKVPKADAVRFEAVLRGRIEQGERRDPVADDLRELIFAGLDGMQTARDLPDVIVSVGADYLLESESELKAERRYKAGSLELDVYFGIKEGSSRDSFPPSALRGPWMHLLQYHPRKALDFFIRVFNRSADWYAHPRLDERLEAAWQVELKFADGTTRKQWANARLWALYRGMYSGPYLLETMLMALEKWLLTFAKRWPEQLDAVLVDILRRSDNAALAAVVASVSVAYPLQSVEALLVLLSVRDYIRIDRSRMAAESQVSLLTGIIPTLRTEHQFYEQERKSANALQHRGRDLEAAITALQFGPHAPRVQALLDKHLVALPSKGEQDESDLTWRLAIHRMDLRQYVFSEQPGAQGPSASANTDPPSHGYVRLDPKPPDADVQAMVDEGAARFATLNSKLGVLLWARRAFRRENDKFDPSQWAATLTEAQTIDRHTDHDDGSRNGPGLVAAVCVRDHWDEMSADQREWCVEVVCSEVMRHAERWNDVLRMQRSSMAADRACAFVLAGLLGKVLPDSQMAEVRKAFAAALTHPIEEVRRFCAASVDRGFWRAYRTIALRCVNSIATEAALVEAGYRAERSRSYEMRRNVRDFIAEAATVIRSRFWHEGAIREDAHSEADISEGFGAESIPRILAILGSVPEDPLAIAAFGRVSRMLVAWWQSDDDHRHRRNRNHNLEAEVSRQLQEFLLRTSPAVARDVLGPVLGAIDRHSRELQSIMQGLTGIQDSNPNTPQYWLLWELFADALKRARWVPHLGDDHPEGSELLSAIFLTAFWKDNVRHWRFLDGYAHLVHSLFESLPPTSIVLDDYVRFLYHVGERSLPEAFDRIAEALRKGNPQEMLQQTNTVYLLEVLLQRHVYGRPLELKRDRHLRESVLHILDLLVENGSSAAFRMRDDFVTPAAAS